MSTQIITTDSLELLVALNGLAKELVRSIDTLRDEMREFRRPATEALLVDINDASWLTGMSVPTLRKACSEGTIGGRTPAPKHTEIGGSIRYKRTELLRWIREDLPDIGGRKNNETA
jgi:predicted DNA-binding transcriptional regulator AlpA